MDKVNDKLDKIAESITEVKVDIAEIRKDLAFHIKRTNDLQSIVERDLPPVEKHVDRVNFLMASLAYLASILAVGSLITTAIKWLD